MTEAVTSSPRVLIVEDEQIVAADLEQTLHGLGYSVVGNAETADAAVRLAGLEHPDVILMDINLGGSMDGITAADEISRRWHIPVIFITGDANEQVMLRATSAAPYGYLTKPFRRRELNGTLLSAISQHHRAQHMLSQHAWLRTTLASLNDAVVATDAEARIRYLNPAAERLIGRALDECAGAPITDVYKLTTPQGEEVGQCQLHKALALKAPVSKEQFLLVTASGARIPIEDSASPIMELGRVSGAVAVFRDITDRVRHENEAIEQRHRLEEQVSVTTEALGQTRSELRALSSHLMTAQEEERRRVARELHDDFGQRTALVELQVSELLRRLGPSDQESTRLLRDIQEQILAIDNGLRNVSHRLHPSVLEDLGLVPALESLIESFRDSASDVVLVIPDPQVDVPLDIATAFYRIAQEALRNAVRHAPTAKVRIELANRSDSFLLTISDAGPGFDLNAVRQGGGLGLISIHERARMVGGLLHLHSAPGEGTRLTVEVPCKPWETKK